MCVGGGDDGGGVERCISGVHVGGWVGACRWGGVGGEEGEVPR